MLVSQQSTRRARSPHCGTSHPSCPPEPAPSTPPPPQPGSQTPPPSPRTPPSWSPRTPPTCTASTPGTVRGSGTTGSLGCMRVPPAGVWEQGCCLPPRGGLSLTALLLCDLPASRCFVFCPCRLAGARSYWCHCHRLPPGYICACGLGRHHAEKVLCLLNSIKDVSVTQPACILPSAAAAPYLLGAPGAETLLQMWLRVLQPLRWAAVLHPTSLLALRV